MADPVLAPDAQRDLAPAIARTLDLFRVALLTSCSRGPLPAQVTSRVVRRLSGVRIFARDELTRAMKDDGLVEIDQRVTGLAQFLSARKPEAV
jgi:hypothetical protein